VSQPKDYGFDEDQSLFKDSIQKFLADKKPIDNLRKNIVGTEDPYHGKKRAGDFDEASWQEMIALGWTAMAVPEEDGGAGMNLVTAACLCEELGRAAIATPLTTTLHSTFVLREAGTGPAHTTLSKIAEGKSCSLAFQDKHGNLDVDATEVTADDNNLSGISYFVQDAQKVDSFIVVAKAASGIGLYLVEAKAPGVEILPDIIVDLTRDQGRLSLSNVWAEVIVEPGMANPEDAKAVIKRAMSAILTMVSADIAGSAEWLLQSTAEYAKLRVQFERPIGFFQAVKHPIVNMMICSDETRSLVYNAACAYDFDSDDAESSARMSKSSASDTAEFCSSRAVQLHGGIGFTWDADIQIYFKRLKHNQFFMGDASWHRQKLGEVI
jgi:alkylation response protein AidB-like acyl-CoA dehydrogenase